MLTAAIVFLANQGRKTHLVPRRREERSHFAAGMPPRGLSVTGVGALPQTPQNICGPNCVPVFNPTLLSPSGPHASSLQCPISDLQTEIMVRPDMAGTVPPAPTPSPPPGTLQPVGLIPLAIGSEPIVDRFATKVRCVAALHFERTVLCAGGWLLGCTFEGKQTFDRKRTSRVCVGRRCIGVLSVRCTSKEEERHSRDTCGCRDKNAYLRLWKQ